MAASGKGRAAAPASAVETARCAGWRSCSSSGRSGRLQARVGAWPWPGAQGVRGAGAAGRRHHGADGQGRRRRAGRGLSGRPACLRPERRHGGPGRSSQGRAAERRAPEWLCCRGTSHIGLESWRSACWRGGSCAAGEVPAGCSGPASPKAVASTPSAGFRSGGTSTIDGSRPPTPPTGSRPGGAGGASWPSFCARGVDREMVAGEALDGLLEQQGVIDGIEQIVPLVRRRFAGQLLSDPEGARRRISGLLGSQGARLGDHRGGAEGLARRCDDEGGEPE